MTSLANQQLKHSFCISSTKKLHYQPLSYFQKDSLREEKTAISMGSRFLPDSLSFLCSHLLSSSLPSICLPRSRGPCYFIAVSLLPCHSYGSDASQFIANQWPHSGQNLFYSYKQILLSHPTFSECCFIQVLATHCLKLHLFSCLTICLLIHPAWAEGLLLALPTRHSMMDSCPWTWNGILLPKVSLKPSEQPLWGSVLSIWRYDSICQNFLQLDFLDNEC